MNRKLTNGRTVNSFLAVKGAEGRNRQVEGLSLYIRKRQNKKNSVLRFIQYWGASDKKRIDNYDMRALMFLFGLLRNIESSYKMPAHLTMIFTDTHAYLNGYASESYKDYFKEVRQILNEFNYSHVLMSEVLMPFIKSHNYKSMPSFVNSVINKSFEYDIPIFLKGRESFKLSENAASAHSFRYYGNQLFGDLKFDSSEQAAYAYIKLNQIEKEYVEKNFHQSVFLTYTSDEEKEFIAPNLPTLQIYSYRKGIRSRPWFSKFNETEKS